MALEGCKWVMGSRKGVRKGQDWRKGEKGNGYGVAKVCRSQRSHSYRDLCRSVTALGRGGCREAYPDGSSGGTSLALRQGSLKSQLKELGSILATSDGRATRMRDVGG